MLKVKVNQARDFDAGRILKLKSAVELCEATVNSEEFKTRILTFGYHEASNFGFGPIKFTRQAYQKGFRWNNGLGREEIFAKIMSGKEVLDSSADNEIDVDITLVMARENGVLGYTYPDTIRTFIYSWFFDSAPKHEIVGNIIHEWCHKIGFDHEFNWNSKRQYTVPYAVGYLARDIAKELY